jgi:hypothetical protein
VGDEDMLLWNECQEDPIEGKKKMSRRIVNNVVKWMGECGVPWYRIVRVCKNKTLFHAVTAERHVKKCMEYWGTGKKWDESQRKNVGDKMTKKCGVRNADLDTWVNELMAEDSVEDRAKPTCGEAIFAEARYEQKAEVVRKMRKEWAISEHKKDFVPHGKDFFCKWCKKAFHTDVGTMERHARNHYQQKCMKVYEVRETRALRPKEHVRGNHRWFGGSDTLLKEVIFPEGWDIGGVKEGEKEIRCRGCKFKRKFREGNLRSMSLAAASFEEHAGNSSGKGTCDKKPNERK